MILCNPRVGAMATRTYTPSLAGADGASTAPQGTVLVADDGRHLAATWTEPAGDACAVTVIHSATGVPRGYYRAFAQWLAGRGHAVLTYDYRGIGGSRAAGPLRHERATMQDWATLDMSAAHDAAEARRGGRDLPLLLVGHSFGGNSLAFARGVERADAVLGVAAQLVGPARYPGVHRWVLRAFFNAWLPAVVGVLGHAPGWSLGGGAQPLPAGVARQWADWGRSGDWAWSDPAMRPHSAISALTVPVHLWNISDDLTYAPPRAVDALAERFRNAAVQRHSITPAELGLKQLGHFGPFRRGPGELLWPRLLAPLEAALATSRRRV